MNRARPPIRNLLVANRGEIAVRIIRTAKALGIRTISVYSEADVGAPHTKLADQAILIGEAPATSSYLDSKRLIEAAKSAGADAIHPGYGFLSENASFAEACVENGLAFVGPSPEAIDLMGDKAAAKRRMIEIGVPCVPGYEGEDQSEETFVGAATQIGFPIMVKAAAGGGGKGMRLVESQDDLIEALQLARAEAENAFGSGVLILEKAIIRPRHVEIQVFGDEFGNLIHLGERDCSVQRRHQKIVEESPCPVMTPELRAEMGKAAVDAAKSIGYVGAGTVEFLLDCDGNFYFLEMNTRLQVEHPVTEFVTGLDLVELQLRVANGAPLGLTQAGIMIDGHAIEARLYAEDPSNGFLPSTGTISHWAPPAGRGVRVDSGIETGSSVSPFYDPMLAKIIGFGDTREIARQRLIDALRHTATFGVSTNRDYLIEILSDQAFIDGQATTAFVSDLSERTEQTGAAQRVRAAAAAAVLQYHGARSHALSNTFNVCDELLNWSSIPMLGTPYRYAQGETTLELWVKPGGVNDYSVACDDQQFMVVIESFEANRATLYIDGVKELVAFHLSDQNGIELTLSGRTFAFQNLNMVMTSTEEAGADGVITAPMHGQIVEIFVGVGQIVEKGDRLAILEAMKMQHVISSPVAGTVVQLSAVPGLQIEAGDKLIEIELDVAADGSEPGSER